MNNIGDSKIPYVYHPQSNGHVGRLHMTLHTALSHYVNKSYTYWDLKLPYFLLAYRATPHSTTGYSPFFLLHAREMVTPANENLRPKIPKPTQGTEQLIESLKARLRQAYQAVAKANRKSHVANKKPYDRRAKHRSFKVGSYIYLFNPARKLGLSKKFYPSWTGPYRVTAKLPDLNYEILGQNGRKLVVHLNRLKAYRGATDRDPIQKSKGSQKARPKQDAMSRPDQRTYTFPVATLPYPFACDNSLTGEPPPSCPPASPPASTLPSAGETETAERSDPNFLPSDFPRSRLNWR